MHNAGKILIIIGIFTVIGGIILYFFGNKLGWIGKLPGDIRIEKENVKIYFPITTMILLSVIISIILAIIHKFFN
jgi:hypothetical protein